MLSYKRPGTGIKPELAHVLVGRELKRDLKKGEVIQWKDI
ncbi:hypothetical protein C1149_01150 [Clostridium botulinum]|nr:hypothetical protein C1149_01150 [Clostridium botulinum]